jgi:glycosyltransferase involved in cell wall biosynthesis
MSLLVSFFSVVPSPYQRDLFRALAQRSEVDLRVHYLEASSPDSPWPEKALADYESVLPGRWFALGNARCHVNWQLPDLRDCSVVVLNTLTSSVTGQWLMRTRLRRQRWMFWGEKMGRGGWLRERLTAPLHRANGIVAIGSVASRDYRERFPEPRHYCIPYHCELAPFLVAPRHAPEDVVVFLFCGQMIARKGVDVLLAAFAQLNERARLLLVGREADLPGLLAPLQESVRARIEYAGFQAPEALPDFFARAHVFVLPSRYDGWGVVVNQALGAALPVVCSDTVGAGQDLVENEVNGLKFPAGDTASLANRMQRFLDTPGIIETWGAASREKARDYLPERGAEKWVEALQQTAAA